MNKVDLIKLLKKHLEKIRVSADRIYLIRLDSTIRDLEENVYKDDEELISDLQSLGFVDIAVQVRRGQYL